MCAQFATPVRVGGGSAPPQPSERPLASYQVRNLVIFPAVVSASANGATERRAVPPAYKILNYQHRDSVSLSRAATHRATAHFSSPTPSFSHRQVMRAAAVSDRRPDFCRNTHTSSIAETYTKETIRRSYASIAAAIRISEIPPPRREKPL